MASSPPITVTTPLGEGVLLFESMTGTERLGQPFRYDLFLLSDSTDVSFADILGQSVTVHMAFGDDKFRHFNGYVTEFELVGTAGQHARYRAVLHPWLWFLGVKANCRIFQNLDAIDIVKQVFLDPTEDFAHDFDDATSEAYEESEFAVQYRETDFNFVSRLMEREGIYYYFKHDDGTHQLVLADSFSAHSPVPGYESLTYHPPDAHREEVEEYIDAWRVSQQIRAGAFAATDFNFKRPEVQLLATVSAPNAHANADFEVFDYPGGYLERGPGETYAGVRLEEIQATFARAEGTTNARGLSVGSTFKLDNFPREDQNREFLVVSATYQLRGHDFGTRSDIPEESVFRCRFGVIESTHPFRSPRSTRKPVVEGPQTAIVVGPDDKEIWVDEYGRVKVQFHWDRKGQHNQKSSCFVRVSQVWAGSGWGAVFTPRIGQEVIVDFLEGDPDRPIITGRVHNGNNMPPYHPKTHPTRSGLRSHSSPGGSQTNYNEIRFEDLKGHEELHIQAEKTQTTLVKGSQAISVGGDRAVGVTGNETYGVKKNRATEITVDDMLTVHGNVGHIFDKMYETTVGDSQATTVKNDYMVKTTDGQVIITHGRSELTIAAGEDTQLQTQNAHVSLKKAGAILIQGDAGDITIKRESTTIVITSDTISITASSEVKVSAKSVTITADNTIDASVGQSKIELTSSGATVSGTMIKLNA